MATEERLQKILAKAGITSRRKAEEIITEGLVTVNGKVAKLGDKATFGKDAIKVRGKLLQAMETPVYLAFYKPKGVISMMVDTENRPTLTDYLQKLEYRLFPIGRLDYMSEGLLLLTNDGDFAEKLQKRDDIPRVYRVKVKGHLTDEMVARLKRGAKIDNRMVRPHSVRVSRELEKKTQVDLVMMGSGAVDIKAMAEMKGFLVDKIIRTAIGHLTLRGLVPGHYRILTAAQAHTLLEKPELGLKRIEDEIEAAKPKGQRNLHEKKSLSPGDGDRGNEAPPRPRSTERPRGRPGIKIAPRAGDARPARDDRGPRGERGALGRARPSRDDRGGFGRGPRRDDDSGYKPRFGDKARFGGGDKARFGGGDKPRFGGDGYGIARPEGGEKPRFGGRSPRSGSGGPRDERGPRGGGSGGGFKPRRGR